MADITYERRQWLRLLWLALPLAALALAWRHLHATGGLGSPSPSRPLLAAALGLGVPGLVLLLLGCLTVQVDARALRWHFGFVGWPRWQVALADIAAIELTRTRWYEGTGIHRTREGWLYNAGPGGAVRIRLKSGRQLRLGSDEPERLAAFVTRRLRPP
ncbi:MAG: hypothetical protein KGK09_01820 [Burkholderiales bacterium]|nr:hypothetical protein [Burkholderiales bacterium]